MSVRSGMDKGAITSHHMVRDIFQMRLCVSLFVLMLLMSKRDGDVGRRAAWSTGAFLATTLLVPSLSTMFPGRSSTPAILHLLPSVSASPVDMCRSRGLCLTYDAVAREREALSPEVHGSQRRMTHCVGCRWDASSHRRQTTAAAITPPCLR